MLAIANLLIGSCGRAAKKREALRFDLPCAAGLGGSASVAFAHGASGGGECGAEGTEGGRLGEGRAEHIWWFGGGFVSGCCFWRWFE